MNYTNQILNNIGVDDVLNSKEENIHRELFNNALSKFKLENKYSDEDYIFTEYRTSKDYLQPSKVIVISKISPYTKHSFDLTKYWDNYKFNKNYERIDNEEENLEIVDLFYSSAKALIRNKYTGEEFKVDFKQCKNIPYSEDWYKFIGDLNSKSSVLEKT